MTTTTTYRHVREAAHHAMSAKHCLCDENWCLHRCLLHTVFMEKVLESYGRAGRRGGSRDVETQTPRDDDECATGIAAADGQRAEQGAGPATGSVGNAGGRRDDDVRETAGKPSGGRSWNPFRWLRPNRVDAAAKPAKAPKVRKVSKAKYIPVRRYPKKKPTTVAVGEQLVPCSRVASSPEVVQPTQQPSEPLHHCTHRNDGAKKVKNRASRGCNPFRWLCSDPVVDPTASPVKIRGAPSRTKPMELRMTRKKNAQKYTVTEELLTSSSTSVFLHVCPL